MFHRVTLSILFVAAAIAASAQTPQGQTPSAPAQPAPTPPGTRASKSPPQPQQEQGLDYFAGTWTFSWVGRDNPLSQGPREGVATFTRMKDANFMDVVVEGQLETGKPFKESAVAAWNAAQRTMAFSERLANGADVLSIGEWATPLAIHVDVQPTRAGNSTLRLRRTYNITAAHSFDVVDEVSADGGPFERLGKAEFTRAAGGAKP